MSRRARWILWGSLALNLFLAGLLAGLLVRGEPTRGERGPRPSRSLMAAAERFDPQDRDGFRALLKQRARESRPRVRALREARREGAAAVAAQPYDPVTARAAFERARIQELALRRELEAEVLAFAARLDPQERAALAEAMRRRGGRGTGGRGREGPRDAPARDPGGAPLRLSGDHG